MNFTLKGSLDPIFTGRGRIIVELDNFEIIFWDGPKFFFVHIQVEHIEFPKPSCVTIDEAMRSLRMTSLIRFASSRLALITTGFPSLSWYVTFRWTRDATTSNFSKRDLYRIPLKAFLRTNTRKLRVIFLLHTHSPNDDIRSFILQGRVIELLKANRYLSRYWFRSSFILSPSMNSIARQS